MGKQYSRIILLAAVLAVGGSLGAVSKTPKAQARVSFSGIQPVESDILVAGTCKVTALNESLRTLWPPKAEHGQRRPKASLELPAVRAEGSVEVLRQGTFLCRPGEMLLPGVDIEFRSMPEGMYFTVPKSGQIVGGVGLWLPGATHVIIGEIKGLGANGYVFTSDPAYPLYFKLVKKTGYVYLCGKGTVRTPSGQVHTLGAQQTRDKWLKLLVGPDPLDRESAARALAWLGEPNLISALERSLTAEKSEAIKMAIKETIEALENRNKSAPATLPPDPNMFLPDADGIKALQSRTCNTSAMLRMEKEGEDLWCCLELNQDGQQIQRLMSVDTGSEEVRLRGQNLIAEWKAEGVFYTRPNRGAPGKLCYLPSDSPNTKGLGGFASCVGAGSTILFDPNSWVDVLGKLYRKGGFQVTKDSFTFLKGTEASAGDGAVYRYDGAVWVRAAP
jgi:hypothetical protein